MKEIGVALILGIASIYDVKTQEIPNLWPCLLCALGFLHCTWASFAGLIFVPLPAFIMTFFNMDAIGGGDIKLMFGCGFCLGVMKGYLTMVFAFAIAYVISKMRKSRKQIIFAPYLMAGSLLAIVL